MSLLQNEDFKTEAQITGAGGTASQLLNDTKVYITGNSINKTLDDAIIDGDIGSYPSWAESSSLIYNLGLSTSVGSNALTISVKDKSGSNPSVSSPAKIGFRNSTSTTGQFNVVSITSALSLTISSGSTLGQRDGIQSYVYIYLINNAGSAELAVSRMPYDEGSIVSTTAEGGAGGADSYSAIYSATARSNVAIRMIGRIYNTQSTAGLWTSAGAELSLVPFEIINIAALMTKTSGQNPGTTALTKITFDSVSTSEQAFDPYSICDLANERIKCPKTGRYKLNINLHLANFEASTTLQLWVYKNGSSYLRYDIASLGLGTTRHFFAEPIVSAEAIDDYFELFTSSGADSSYQIVGNTGVDTKSFLGITYLGRANV